MHPPKALNWLQKIGITVERPFPSGRYYIYRNGIPTNFSFITKEIAWQKVATYEMFCSLNLQENPVEPPSATTYTLYLNGNELVKNAQEYKDTIFFEEEYNEHYNVWYDYYENVKYAFYSILLAEFDMENHPKRKKCLETAYIISNGEGYEKMYQTFKHLTNLIKG